MLFATHLPEFIASLSSIESFAPSKASTPSHWMTDKGRKLYLFQNNMKSILVFLMKIKLITFTVVVCRSFGITFFCIGKIVLQFLVTLWFWTFYPVGKYIRPIVLVGFLGRAVKRVRSKSCRLVQKLGHPISIYLKQLLLYHFLFSYSQRRDFKFRKLMRSNFDLKWQQLCICARLFRKWPGGDVQCTRSKI